MRIGHIQLMIENAFYYIASSPYFSRILRLAYNIMHLVSLIETLAAKPAFIKKIKKIAVSGTMPEAAFLYNPVLSISLRFNFSRPYNESCISL